MRLSPKPAEFYPVLKPVNLSDFCTGVHILATRNQTPAAESSPSSLGIRAPQVNVRPIATLET